MHSIRIFYRPDDYPEWLQWKDFVQQFQMIGLPGELDAGGRPKTRPGFAPRATLEKPENRCDTNTGRNLRRGYQFQVRMMGRGHAVITRFRLHAQKLVENSKAK